MCLLIKISDFCTNLVDTSTSHLHFEHSAHRRGCIGSADCTSRTPSGSTMPHPYQRNMCIKRIPITVGSTIPRTPFISSRPDQKHISSPLGVIPVGHHRTDPIRQSHRRNHISREGILDHPFFLEFIRDKE